MSEKFIENKLYDIIRRIDRLQATVEQTQIPTAPQPKGEPKEMKIKEFCEAYGWSRDTVYDYIYDKSKHFPAHKIGGKWYINIAKYKRWCEVEHVNSYKYAN